MKLSKPLRRLFLYPLLMVGGCHLLLTGSPIPLWRLESLQAPVPVLSVTEHELQLQDDRRVVLPFLRRIPHDNPLFQAALSHGVEVTDEGEVYGLMWLDPHCGNDPVSWRRMRVNLSDLAAALAPGEIDFPDRDSDRLEDRLEFPHIDQLIPSRSHDRRHLTVWDMISLRQVRARLIESSPPPSAELRPEN